MRGLHGSEGSRNQREGCISFNFFELHLIMFVNIVMCYFKVRLKNVVKKQFNIWGIELKLNVQRSESRSNVRPQLEETICLAQHRRIKKLAWLYSKLKNPHSSTSKGYQLT